MPEETVVGSEIIAAYGKALEADMGFLPGPPDGAEELLRACDAVLTRRDGKMLLVACFVDCVVDPDRRFGLPRYEVLRIGDRALKATLGSEGRQARNVRVEIFEIGRPRTPLSRWKLAAWNGGPADNVRALKWSLDARDGSIWPPRDIPLVDPTSAIAHRVVLTVSEEIGPDAPMVAATVVNEHAGDPPVAVVFLLAVLAIVFAFSVGLARGTCDGPGCTEIGIFAALGAVSGELVAQGQVYRLVSSAFLHADFGHLVSNAIGLVIGGAALERVSGGAWTIAVFVFGAVGGSLLSMATAHPESLSLGASGGVVAIAAAALVSSARLSGPLGRGLAQAGGAVILFSIVDSWIAGIPTVNHMAHFGGALTGFGMGMAELAFWRQLRLNAWPASLFNLANWLALVLAALSLALMTINYNPLGAR